MGTPRPRPPAHTPLLPGGPPATQMNRLAEPFPHRPCPRLRGAAGLAVPPSGSGGAPGPAGREDGVQPPSRCQGRPLRCKVTLRELLPPLPWGGGALSSAPALTVKTPTGAEVPAHVGAPMAVTPSSTWRRRLPGPGARGAGALRGGREGAASPPPQLSSSQAREEGPRLPPMRDRRPVHPLPDPSSKDSVRGTSLRQSGGRPCCLGVWGAPGIGTGSPLPAGMSVGGARSRPNSPRVGGQRDSAKRETRLFAQKRGRTEGKFPTNTSQPQGRRQPAGGCFLSRKRTGIRTRGTGGCWRPTRVTSAPRARA